MTTNDTTKPTFKVKAGGEKGKAIVEILTNEPNLSRKAIAEKAGATTGRVGEVIRFLAAEGTATEKKVIGRHMAAQAKAKLAPKTDN